MGCSITSQLPIAIAERCYRIDCTYRRLFGYRPVDDSGERSRKRADCHVMTRATEKIEPWRSRSD